MSAPAFIEQQRQRTPRLCDELRAIRERRATLRVCNTRSPEDILGYDKTGVPR